MALSQLGEWAISIFWAKCLSSNHRPSTPRIPTARPAQKHPKASADLISTPIVTDSQDSSSSDPGGAEAYDRHSQITLEALAPVGDFERSLAQSVADDRWRLKRARSIEASLFALGLQAGSEDDTSSRQVDEAFAQARTWLAEARNLQLLSIYEQRIQRSVDKNTAELRIIQAQRKQQAQEAMHQAKLLYQLDKAEGKPWQPEAYFTPFPQSREFVFSTPDVVRELRLAQRLSEAKLYGFSHKPSKEERPAIPAEARDSVPERSK